MDSLAGAVTSYRHPGKVSRTQVGRMAASKLPGGFSLAAAKQYLEAKYGLGPERQNGAFLHALTMEPAARLDSKQKAETWLDSVATSYAQANGVSLGRCVRRENVNRLGRSQCAKPIKLLLDHTIRICVMSLCF